MKKNKLSNRTTKVKREISHKELDKNQDKKHISARYTPIGAKRDELVLIDKIIYPINVCPFCKSKSTFHRVIQENRDLIGNIWRGDLQETQKGIVTTKFDYCLDCHREFLIELYIFSKMVRDIESVKKRKKKSKFRKLLKKVFRYI